MRSAGIGELDEKKIAETTETEPPSSTLFKPFLSRRGAFLHVALARRRCFRRRRCSGYVLAIIALQRLQQGGGNRRGRGGGVQGGAGGEARRSNPPPAQRGALRASPGDFARIRAAVAAGDRVAAGSGEVDAAVEGGAP